MILRLRTNLGLHRITVSPTTSYPQLLSSITSQLLHTGSLSSGVATKPFSLAKGDSAARNFEGEHFIKDDCPNIMGAPHNLGNGDVLFCFISEGAILMTGGAGTGVPSATAASFEHVLNRISGKEPMVIESVPG